MEGELNGVPISGLDQEDEVNEDDYILITKNGEPKLTKKTNIRAFQKKNFARTAALNILFGI